MPDDSTYSLADSPADEPEKNRPIRPRQRSVKKPPEESRTKPIGLVFLVCTVLPALAWGAFVAVKRWGVSTEPSSSSANPVASVLSVVGIGNDQDPKTSFAAFVAKLAKLESDLATAEKNGDAAKFADLQGDDVGTIAGLSGEDTVRYTMTLRGCNDTGRPDLDMRVEVQVATPIVFEFPLSQFPVWAALPAGSPVTFDAKLRAEAMRIKEFGEVKTKLIVRFNVLQIVAPSPTPAPVPQIAATVESIEKLQNTLKTGEPAAGADRTAFWHFLITRAEGPATGSRCDARMVKAWANAEFRLAAALNLATTLNGAEPDPLLTTIVGDILAESAPLPENMCEGILARLPPAATLTVFARLLQCEGMAAERADRLFATWESKSSGNQALSEAEKTRQQSIHTAFVQSKDPLRKLLKLRTDASRVSALENLLRFRTYPAMIEILFRYRIDPDDVVREGALDVLRRMSDPPQEVKLPTAVSVSETLDRLRNAPSPDDKKAVLELITRCGAKSKADESAAEQLALLVADPDAELAAFAARALVSYGADRPTADEKQLGSTQSPAWLKLFRRSLEASQGEARTIIEAFINQKDWSPARSLALNQAIPVVLPSSGAKTSDNSPDLTQQIELVGRDGLIQAVVERLSSPTNKTQFTGNPSWAYHGPVKVLLALGDPQELAIPKIEPLLKSDQPIVVERAMNALCSCGAEAVDVLQRACDSEDEQLSTVARRIVADRGPDELAVSILTESLKSASLEELPGVLQTLSRRKTAAEPALPVLKQLFAKYGDNEAVRERIRRCVAEIDARVWQFDPDFRFGDAEKAKAIANGEAEAKSRAVSGEEAKRRQKAALDAAKRRDAKKKNPSGTTKAKPKNTPN